MISHHPVISNTVNISENDQNEIVSNWQQKSSWQRFGFRELRPAQKEVLDHLLAGQNTVAILPTGYGKSLCYQLAGLALPNLTVVVSPLLALMKDQVEGLNNRGLAAASWNSLTPWPRQQQIRQQITSQQLKFLYLSPEKLLSKPTTSLLSKVKISQLVVDEAHCISHWGRDFRPSYRKIGDWINKYQQRQTQPLVSAFTATATKQCYQDICSFLNLSSPAVVQRPPYRPNLRYQVITVPSEGWKRRMIIFFLQYCLQADPGGTLIYTTTRLQTVWLNNWLHDHGFQHAHCFHGGLSKSEKSTVFKYFHQHSCPVVVTTNAFGMGVDFPNVRYVIHHCPPLCLDDYVQEAGRAGRDGRDAYPILLNLASDFAKIYNLMNSDEKLAVDSSLLTANFIRKKQASDMLRYINSRGCLQKQITDYFHLPGSKKPSFKKCHCQHCDQREPWKKFKLWSEYVDR